MGFSRDGRDALPTWFGQRMKTHLESSPAGFRELQAREIDGMLLFQGGLPTC